MTHRTPARPSRTHRHALGWGGGGWSEAAMGRGHPGPLNNRVLSGLLPPGGVGTAFLLRGPRPARGPPGCARCGLWGRGGVRPPGTAQCRTWARGGGRGCVPKRWGGAAEGAGGPHPRASRVPRPHATCGGRAGSPSEAHRKFLGADNRQQPQPQHFLRPDPAGAMARPALADPSHPLHPSPQCAPAPT